MALDFNPFDKDNQKASEKRKVTKVKVFEDPPVTLPLPSSGVEGGRYLGPADHKEELSLDQGQEMTLSKFDRSQVSDGQLAGVVSPAISRNDTVEKKQSQNETVSTFSILGNNLLRDLIEQKKKQIGIEAKDGGLANTSDSFRQCQNSTVLESDIQDIAQRDPQGQAMRVLETRGANIFEPGDEVQDPIKKDTLAVDRDDTVNIKQGQSMTVSNCYMNGSSQPSHHEEPNAEAMSETDTVILRQSQNVFGIDDQDAPVTTDGDEVNDTLRRPALTLNKDVVSKLAQEAVKAVSGYNQIPQFLLRKEGLWQDSLDFMIYLHMFSKSYGFGRRWCDMGQSELQDFSNATKNTVKASLNRLSADGWILCIRSQKYNQITKRWLIFTPSQLGYRVGESFVTISGSEKEPVLSKKIRVYLDACSEGIKESERKTALSLTEEIGMEALDEHLQLVMAESEMKKKLGSDPIGKKLAWVKNGALDRNKEKVQKILEKRDLELWRRQVVIALPIFEKNLSLEAQEKFKLEMVKEFYNGQFPVSSIAGEELQSFAAHTWVKRNQRDAFTVTWQTDND